MWTVVFPAFQSVLQSSPLKSVRASCTRLNPEFCILIDTKLCYYTYCRTHLPFPWCGFLLYPDSVFREVVWYKEFPESGRRCFQLEKKKKEGGGSCRQTNSSEVLLTSSGVTCIQQNLNQHWDKCFFYRISYLRNVWLKMYKQLAAFWLYGIILKCVLLGVFYIILGYLWHIPASTSFVSLLTRTRRNWGKS